MNAGARSKGVGFSLVPSYSLPSRALALDLGDTHRWRL